MPPLLLPLCAIALLLSGCSAAITEAERQEALQFHNHLRRSVVPPAANIYAMGWDSRLEELAQRAADSCRFEHNYGGDYAGLGENLYRGGRRNFTEILMFMFMERELYDFEQAKCVTGAGTKYPWLTSCGHYLQIVSAKVTRVGCGVTKCGDNFLVVCEYDKYYSSPPYVAGEPGTKCKDYGCGYVYDKLCYSTASYMPPAPVPRASLDCKLQCLNYGQRTSDWLGCRCTCPRGYYGLLCQDYYDSSRKPSTCEALAVTCRNGGTPTMDGSVCRCACPAGFRGDRCEENIQLVSNSVFWYFGQQMRYSSYYPVDAKFFERHTGSASLMYHYLAMAINQYCKANYTTCCPEATEATTTEDFVKYCGYGVTEGYPAGAIDGSLKVGVNFRMTESQAAKCNLGITPLVNRNSLLAASKAALDEVTAILNKVNLKVVRIE